MILQTQVNIQPMEHTIAYGDGVLFLGSCFADEVGTLCKGLGFDAQVNPFGVLFNPASIAQSVERLDSERPFAHDEVISVGEDCFCTFSHNTKFWRVSEDELLNDVNDELKRYSGFFSDAKWVVVSLGTSWVYRNKEIGQIVSNCHKLPSQQFEREFMTVEKSIDCLSAMVSKHPDKHFIFTVSPLRHLKDGLHENQLSKSVLLLAVDAVCKRFANAYYFPAYEIMNDELRDYRFYNEDMVHPTVQAVQYIWERFVEFAVNPLEMPAMNKALELKQMLHHKPLFPESEAYRKFEIMRDKKLYELRECYPLVRIENL